MIDAVVVPIEDLTDFDATDEATRGCIYQYYNTATEEFEFYVSDGATLQKIMLESTVSFKRHFLLMGS